MLPLWSLYTACLQLRKMQEASAEAASKSAELTVALEASEVALSEARQLAAQQASRLSHLESEFEALQEVMGEGEQRDIVGRLLSRISNLQAAAVTAEATRRQLHNQMVELRGNVSMQTQPTLTSPPQGQYCLCRKHVAEAVP